MLKSRVLINIAISIFAVGLQVFVISLVSRISPEHVAVIGIIELVVSWGVALAYFGGEQHFVNFVNKHKDVPRKRVVMSVMSLAIILMFVFYFLYFSIGKSILNDFEKLDTLSLQQEYLISAIAFLITLLTIIVSFFRAQLDITIAVLCEKSYVILFSILVIAILVSIKFNSDLSVNSIYIAAVLAAFVSLLFWYGYFLFGNKHKVDLLSESVNSNLSHRNILRRYISREGAYFYLTAIIIIIFERIDQLVLVSTIGLTALGGYYACYKLSFAVRFISKTINTAIFPYLSRFASKDNPNELYELYLINRKTNFIIALVFTFILYTFSESILFFLFDDTFSQYEIVLEIMAVALLFSSLNQVDFNFLNALGKSKVFFQNSILTVSVQVIFIILFYSQLEVTALVLARLFAVIVGYLFASWHLRKYGQNYIPLFICSCYLVHSLAKVFI